MNLQDSTIYLVDDDAAVLKSTSRLLRAAGFHVVGFSSPQEFLAQHDSSASCCLILDLAMPGLNGLELQQRLASAGKFLPIIFLTGRASVSTSVTAMKQGAIDLLTKPVERDILIQAIERALTRDRAARKAKLESDEIQNRLHDLTPREYEVFQHVIRGQLNKQIAACLGTAEKTVKVHRARVMKKMKVDSVADLVRLSERAGVAPPLVLSN